MDKSTFPSLEFLGFKGSFEGVILSKLFHSFFQPLFKVSYNTNNGNVNILLLLNYDEIK